MPRRDFLRLSAVAGVALAGLPMAAQARRFAGFVPRDKGLSKQWLASIKAPGDKAVYREAELKYIGMPIGGICAGQVYLGGDGRLWLWDVFNEIKLGTVPKRVAYRGSTIEAGGGANYVEPPEQVHPFEQGFALKAGGKVRRFDASGWSDVSFVGEYPIGTVEYRDPECPIAATLEAFSPFIPLDPDDSGLPAVLMSYRLKNSGSEHVEAEIAGWMENPTGIRTVPPGEAIRRNRWSPSDSRLDFLIEEPASESDTSRPPILFEDWNQEDYEGWTVSGTAFGPGPMAKTALGGHVGGPGEKFAKSYNIRNGEDNVRGDAHLGRLASRPFKIERKFVEFYIGGGNHPNKACMNLVVDGQVVRTATGRQEDHLRLERWDVRELEGKQATIEIVDDEPGFWGQIGVGQIEFVDQPTRDLSKSPDFGEMSLAILQPKATDRAVMEIGDPALLFESPSTGAGEAQAPTPGKPRSGLVRQVRLAPGEEATVVFVVAWRFPNLTLNRLGEVGHFYAQRFPTAASVVDYIAKNHRRLTDKTKLWHRTWYDSTLPHWFLDRMMASASTLATMTCVRFANGRFYGWEGIGCCDGTCGHVWQYAQTVGRLFPSLERGVRETVDYGVAFHPENGLIDFRGEYGFGFAADAQAGYVLRTYREHQTSPDDAFLPRVYPRMRQALEHLIGHDGDDNGILEGRQHNTLDVDLYGPSSWLTSLYLAALRAGEEMAKETGDTAFASRCRTLFDRGSRQFTRLFFNGEYFVQRLDLKEHPEALRYGNGCEIDQAMGQGWAFQVGLGRITESAPTRKALSSLYRNNFLSDVGPFRDRYKPGRWYAVPGESGLLTCTFPKGNREEILGPNPTWASMYFNECWTGCEYEAAGHMMAEGLVDEALTIVRAVHDRHHPVKRNPWNEVECSDHYARGMASHGVFIAATGFEYHGPKGAIGFAPKIRPESFRAAFTAAEGWGTYRQSIGRESMEAGIRVNHGSLRLKGVTLEVPRRLGDRMRATLGSKALAARTRRKGTKLVVSLADELRIEAGEELEFHTT
ncbi:MAG TPA: GH116 family glycosyl hydrolase [Fimbriimonas sp.]